MAKSRLEAQFHHALRTACAEAAALGYYPSYFIQKMERVGAAAYARELVRSGELQSGLRRLKSLGRLDLSVEHLVARVPEYQPLFTNEERQAAEWRLKQIEAAQPSSSRSS